MSLFNETSSSNKTVHISIFQYWFFWTWTVSYEGSNLFNRGGFTLSSDAALRKCEKAVKRIINYEFKEKK